MWFDEMGNAKQCYYLVSFWENGSCYDERDGGFTRWNKFEEAPEGWAWRYDISSLLCPRCSEEYKNLLKWFMERNSIYKAVKEEIDRSLGDENEED